MINSLGAGRVDARTFEDLGRKQREIAEAEAALKERDERRYIDSTTIFIYIYYVYIYISYK